jgi:signal transduction histidine kinase
MIRYPQFLIPQRISSRVSVILCILLVLSQGLVLTIFYLGGVPQADLQWRRLIAARLGTFTHIAEALPASDIAQAAQKMEDAGWKIKLLTEAPTEAVHRHDADDATLRRFIMQESGLAKQNIFLSMNHDGSERQTSIILGLPSGLWVSVRVHGIYRWHFRSLEQIGFAVSFFLSMIWLSFWFSRQVTTPLTNLAIATERAGLKFEAMSPPDDAPEEIRRIILAFNSMHARLGVYLVDRARMLAAISHDLRTPLTRLRLRLESNQVVAERKKSLQDVAMMESMLGAALAFIRDEQADKTLEHIDFAELLQMLCDEVSDNGAEASYTGPAHLKFLCCPQNLSRAFGNLVDNAIKFTGSVHINMSVLCSKFVEITIEDNGPGIPTSEKIKVFEPFYRIDDARCGEKGGFGLGLAVARTLILEHGGEIELRDGDPQGLVVRVRLPRLTDGQED